MKRAVSVCLVLFLEVVIRSTTAWIVAPQPWAGENRHLNRFSTALSAETSSSVPEFTGKTLYQRVFYRLSPGSQVAVHNAVCVEERVRFQADPENPSYMKPVGHRTLILRDGQVEDGEIGDDFFTLTVHDHNGESTHTGAGTDFELESEIATAIYLASNPDLCKGRVLEVGCSSGVASLLGCIGAGFITRKLAADKDWKNKEHDVAEDILTIGKAVQDDKLLPKDLEILVLTDTDERHLNAAFHNCKYSGVSAAKVAVEPLDWKLRERSGVKEFYTVIASDLAFSFPEAKALARTVAHRVAPSQWYDLNGPLPTFVHVCPDVRDDVTYLHKFLSQGYKMSVRTGYLKLEKIRFVVQSLPSTDPESALDDEELEVQSFKDIPFQSLTAQHHPDYAGQGSGEFFFPMETGEYDVRGGSTYLEPDSSSSSPW